MRRTDEGGFTLVELLVTLVIGGLLATTLVSTLVLGFRTYAGVRDGMEASARAQVTIGRFTSDVMSSEIVRTGSSACGGSGFVQGFTWNVGPDDDMDVAIHADWYFQDGELSRRVCGNRSAGPDTLMVRLDAVEMDCWAERWCWLRWRPGAAPLDGIDVYRRVDS